MILVSACLCGVNCKYNGLNNLDLKIKEFLKDKDYMLICPEQMGGMSTPRVPSEIVEEKVYSKKGDDVTEFFYKGARETLYISELIKAKYALLKEGSPSCGCNLIYDGSFAGRKVSGKGITAKLLESNGIKVFSEEEISKLNEEIEKSE